MPKGGMPPLPGWQDRFLENFEKTHLIRSACIAAGVGRTYFYKARKEDEAFRERFEEAEMHSTEMLENIAYHRAATDSDTLMIFLLKARKPEMYRENIRHDHNHAVDGQIQLVLPDGQQPIELPAAKRREAAQLLLEAHESVIDSTAEDIDTEE